jgi:hypothetical protein
MQRQQNLPLHFSNSPPSSLEPSRSFAATVCRHLVHCIVGSLEQLCCTTSTTNITAEPCKHLFYCLNASCVTLFSGPFVWCKLA